MDRNHVTGKILHLTLKIIYLLTGEDYVPIKRSDDDEDITAPSPYERHNDEKILELTNQIIQLLTGEGVHRKDKPTSNTEEDADICAAPQCKEEDVPVSISADQSSQTNPQDNKPGIQDGAQCKEEESSAELSSGKSKLSRLHQSGQGPMVETRNMADLPGGRGVDPTDTMDTRLNIVVVDAGDGELRFKEEEEEIPIGPRPDSSMDTLRKPSRPLHSKEYLEEDDESDDSETEEDEDDGIAGLNIIVKSEETETRVKIKREELAADPGPGSNKTCLERGTARHVTATSAAGQKLHAIDRRLVTAEKPFFCADCGGFFKHKSSLVLHRRIHSGEKPFSCSQCGKEFIQKANYIRHQRLHTGEKPYKCTECGKLYAQKQSLIMHQKFHAENEPFSCPECGENFIRQSHLVNHRKTHKGLKRYSCPDCGDFFMLRSSLVIHQRVHSAEKPVQML
ncbi:uncharacterized protein RB166_021301 [Leptodactylus fuscus]|uniref:uncharacterized protein LOC142187869 n=1 Tax=Leptodactylus fuscus TaxID=238119 RepID=UPI003F4EE9F2